MFKTNHQRKQEKSTPKCEYWFWSNDFQNCSCILLTLLLLSPTTYSQIIELN